MCPFKPCFFFFLDICPIVGLLDHKIALLLVFQETSILFSIVVVPVYISTNSVGGFPFLHILSCIYCSQIFWWWPSNWCEVVSHPCLLHWQWIPYHRTTWEWITSLYYAKYGLPFNHHQTNILSYYIKVFIIGLGKSSVLADCAIT